MLDSKKKFFVHDSSFVDENCRIGTNTKIWHFSHIMGGSYIGDNCNIGQNVVISPDVVIGNNVKIQNNVSVYEGVTLEDYVFCGPSCVFTNVLLPRCEFPQRGSELYTKTLVKKSESIGANSTIICGNTIGEYSFIGAGTVVSKDVPPHALVVGNPGKICGWVDKKGYRLKFKKNNSETLCGRYKLENDLLITISNDI